MSQETSQLATNESRVLKYFEQLSGEGTSNSLVDLFKYFLEQERRISILEDKVRALEANSHSNGQ